MRRFARAAPSKTDKRRSVDIRITDMTASDALWWDTRLGPAHARDASRADRYWVWSVLLPLCHLVQRAKRRDCRPLVIWARNDTGRFVRAGMCLVIEEYPYLDVRHPADANFLWFLSAADSAVLRHEFAMSDPPALGRVLIDVAIVLSQNAGLGGRIGLHAARAGGDGLLGFYAYCGLIPLPRRATLPASVQRPNDGRFFYADESVAEALAAALDPTR
jgi:hypothetical protein